MDLTRTTLLSLSTAALMACASVGTDDTAQVTGDRDAPKTEETDTPSKTAETSEEMVCTNIKRTGYHRRERVCVPKAKLDEYREQVRMLRDEREMRDNTQRESDRFGDVLVGPN